MPTAHGSVRSNSDWYEPLSPRSKRSWKARTYASATSTPSNTSWGSEWRCSGKLAERRRRRMGVILGAVQAAPGPAEYRGVLNLVAFSKDRPAQLDLLLRSVRRFAGPATATAVVYTASDELYERGYRAVREEHPGVTFVDERESGGFKAATLGLVAEAGHLVAFLVDD